MTTRTLRILTLLALAGALAALAGCAKKAVQTPPAPATPPPTTAPTTPVPAPTPTPTETTPAPAMRAEDLRPVYFDLDVYTLSAEARSVLDANARVLRDNASVRLVVEGHCDERGTVEYNQALGERRAQAARDYLVNAGIDGARLSVISYGKERPFATGSDEASWAQNRRAHFTLR